MYFRICFFIFLVFHTIFSFFSVLTFHCISMQDCPVVPIGRSPRTDVLLKAEKVVLELGGCVLRLAGLYISFQTLEA